MNKYVVWIATIICFIGLIAGVSCKKPSEKCWEDVRNNYNCPSYDLKCKMEKENLVKVCDKLAKDEFEEKDRESWKKDNHIDFALPRVPVQ